MDRIDACLPLLARDLERFQILRRSLELNFEALGRCWVMVADAEYAEFRSRLSSPFEVIPESEVFPEIARYRFLHRLLHGRFRRLFPFHASGRFRLTGWYIQQILKFGIASRIETPFYLTLDADVVCIKPTTHADLVQNGRALVTTEPKDVHPQWYACAERLLGYSRSGRNFGVTPSLLHREGVLALQAHLESRFIGHWRGALVRNTPWTEYTLYHTFMEGSGRWDRCHVDGGAEAVYDTEASFWWEKDDWSVARARSGKAHFIIAQSNTGIPVEVVRSALEAAGVFERR